MAQLRKVNFKLCDMFDYLSFDLNCTMGILYSNTNTSVACSVPCVLPCSEIQDDANSNVVTWSQTGGAMSEYINFLTGNPRFYDLFNISANATGEEITAATTSKAATDFFKSRFLQVTIQFSFQSFVELKDVAAFSVDAMGAQIGGVLTAQSLARSQRYVPLRDFRPPLPLPNQLRQGGNHAGSLHIRRTDG